MPSATDFASAASGCLSANAAGLVSTLVTPSHYARQLLGSLTLSGSYRIADDHRDPAVLWVQSGAMALSGHGEGCARHCPAPLAACAQGAWLALAALCPDKLDATFPAYQLLGERGALSQYDRRGRVSPGGACRILASADGFIAINLPRPDDFELLPAWLESDVTAWAGVEATLRQRASAEVIERGRLLGLACATVAKPMTSNGWYQQTRCGRATAPPTRSPLVIDLSSLWAGPLCGQLLNEAGARVIKVESTARPDGARRGNAAFFDLMNSGKESLALDLSAQQGREQLSALLKRADIIIESTRPRALEQMGIFAADILAANPGAVWLAISGYGRGEPQRDWIAYGDDAGVAAGLSWLMGGDQGDPVFCGDAIADPLTGLHAAVLATAAWKNGGGVVLDISLEGVVSHCIAAGEVDFQHCDLKSVAPVARASKPCAAEFSADTERLLREFR